MTNVKPGITARTVLAEEETLGFGMWAMIQRHPVSVMVVMSLSLLLGGALYWKLPPSYEATADVLVETVQTTGLISSEGVDDSIPTKNLETHALIVCSPLILGEAVSRHQLDRLPSLMDAEDPVEAIRRHLIVQPKDESSTVLTILYTGRDSDDCKRIVEALVETYDQFLKEANQQVKMETVQLITRARDELAGQLVQREAAYSDFQAQAKLMRRDGQGVNHHHERQLEVERSRTAAFVEKARLDAQLETAVESVATGGPRKEAVYFESVAALAVSETGNSLFDRSLDDGVMAQRHYRATLIQRLRNLQIREAELLVRFAEGHPDVAAVRQQIRDLEYEIRGVPVTRSSEEGATEVVTEGTSRHGENRSDPEEALHQLLVGMSPQHVPGGSPATDELARRDPTGLDAPLVMPQARGPIDDSAMDEEAPDLVAIYTQGLQQRLAELHRELSGFDTVYELERQAANDLQEFLVRDESLRDDAARTRQLLDVVAIRCDEVNVVKSRGGDTLRVLAEPQRGDQVAPNLAILLLGAGVIGLMGGIGVAFYIDHHEAMLRSPEEVRRVMRAPVIGQVPFVNPEDQIQRKDRRRYSPMLSTIQRSESIVAEAYRSIRTMLYFNAKDERRNVIQVTSSVPGEGKTTLTANLAVAIAQSGKRVAVLDADFRRPKLHALFCHDTQEDASATFGLARVIEGDLSFAAACVRTGIPNLTFCPAGTRPDNPSELLTSQSFVKLLDRLRARYDWVLLDTPPLLAVTDSSIIAARADGVLFNLRMRRGMRHVSIQSREMLAKVGANLVGVVVNAVDDLGDFATMGYGSGAAYFPDPSRDRDEQPGAARNEELPFVTKIFNQ